MRESWTSEVHPDKTGKLRAVVDGGYSEAHREAGALNDRLDEFERLVEALRELPPESLGLPPGPGH